MTNDLHYKLTTYANHLGCGQYSEDVVQEAYLKVLSKDIQYNDSYLFMTVRSLAMDLHKANKRITKVNIENFKHILISEESESYINIKDYSQNLTKFETMLVDVMSNNDISQRQLARESGISTITINKTVKRIRKKIKDEWQRKEQQEVKVILSKR